MVVGIDDEENKSVGNPKNIIDLWVEKHPKLLNKNMGKNNIVSVNPKDILSLNPIKYEYPNNYKEKRYSAIVGGFKY